MSADPLKGIRVGDPAPRAAGGPRICIADDSSGWHCTREAGHPGHHIADTGRKVVATWFDDPVAVYIAAKLAEAPPLSERQGDRLALIVKVDEQSE